MGSREDDMYWDDREWIVQDEWDDHDESTVLDEELDDETLREEC
jgi:hypothetical protein